MRCHIRGFDGLAANNTKPGNISKCSPSASKGAVRTPTGHSAGPTRSTRALHANRPPGLRQTDVHQCCTCVVMSSNASFPRPAKEREPHGEGGRWESRLSRIKRVDIV